jgi:RnfABCDGE-type electron transport complex B subunit
LLLWGFQGLLVLHKSSRVQEFKSLRVQGVEEMNIILISTITMGGLGLIFAIILAISNKKLYVKEDPRIENILEKLPGANCGACGYASCYDLAQKIVKGEAKPTGCPVGGSEVAEDIANILGIESQKVITKVAIVHCGATQNIRKKRAFYLGGETCKVADIVGGEIACYYGCLGYGDCVDACLFDAIRMEEGLPVVDLIKCTGCGQCVEVCPRNIITLEVYNAKKQSDAIVIACNNPDKGAVVRKICKVGCIGCGLCEKNCGDGSFYMDELLARIDYSKVYDCEHWDAVIEKCPAKTIKKLPKESKILV